MSQPVRVKFSRHRSPAWRHAMRTGYAPFNCRHCGTEYGVVLTLADLHEQDPCCPICSNVGRESWETDLRLMRLLGVKE